MFNILNHDFNYNFFLIEGFILLMFLHKLTNECTTSFNIHFKNTHFNWRTLYLPGPRVEINAIPI